MAYRKVDDASLSSVANAIRQKGGTSGKLAFPNDFVSAISNIETGSGEPSAVLGTKDIDKNGTYYAVNDGLDGFSTVNVNVPSSGVEVNLQSKPAKPTTEFQLIYPDEGYVGMSRVELAAIQTQSKDIYRNGTYAPDTGKFFDSVTVNVLTGAELGEATSYTFGQIGISQTSLSASYSTSETIHVEDGEIVLDNATSQTFTMRSSDTSGSCFNGLRGLYFQKSGTTYYVPPDCSIVRSAVKGSGNATTAYAYKGSIYPVVVDAGTVMGTKNITENGTYYASADGFDGFESVNVNVPTSGGGSDTANRPVILEVEKVTADTYASETTYQSEEFIILEIYPKSGGTVTVTYGGITKIITDDGTAEEPNAQQVVFGTFNGVVHDAEIPASGTLTIDGDYAAFAADTYHTAKSSTTICDCITKIVDFGKTEYIPANAFGGALSTGGSKLKSVNIPSNISSIGSAAFANTGLTYFAIPDGVPCDTDALVMGCNNLRDIIIPDSITTIGVMAICSCGRLMGITLHEGITSIGDGAFSSNPKLRYIRCLATTPPIIASAESSILNVGEGFVFESIFVPSGCGEAYKTAVGWSNYADYIVEEAE